MIRRCERGLAKRIMVPKIGSQTRIQIMVTRRRMRWKNLESAKKVEKFLDGVYIVRFMKMPQLRWIIKILD